MRDLRVIVRAINERYWIAVAKTLGGGIERLWWGPRRLRCCSEEERSDPGGGHPTPQTQGRRDRGVPGAVCRYLCMRICASGRGGETFLSLRDSGEWCQTRIPHVFTAGRGTSARRLFQPTLSSKT